MYTPVQAHVKAKDNRTERGSAEVDVPSKELR